MRGVINNTAGSLVEISCRKTIKYINAFENFTHVTNVGVSSPVMEPGLVALYDVYGLETDLSCSYSPGARTRPFVYILSTSLCELRTIV